LKSLAKKNVLHKNDAIASFLRALLGGRQTTTMAALPVANTDF
jgi:hypothetical protein